MSSSSGMEIQAKLPAILHVWSGMQGLGSASGHTNLDARRSDWYISSMMSELAPGLLVAAPPLGDPNFDQSVVLLAAHGDDGAFGWVINGRNLMTLSELLVRAEITKSELDI